MLHRIRLVATIAPQAIAYKSMIRTSALTRGLARKIAINVNRVTGKPRVTCQGAMFFTFEPSLLKTALLSSASPANAKITNPIDATAIAAQAPEGKRPETRLTLKGWGALGGCYFCDQDRADCC